MSLRPPANIFQPFRLETFRLAGVGDPAGIPTGFILKPRITTLALKT